MGRGRGWPGGGAGGGGGGREREMFTREFLPRVTSMGDCRNGKYQVTIMNNTIFLHEKLQF